ncbi:MAG: DNA polymerase III subunit delta [Gammaproteobacteria bacterium]
MILQPDKLNDFLERDPLKPAYLVFGDEPLQIMESVDAIRSALRANGASERIVIDVERGYDWDELPATLSGMSLFAEQRIIEIKLGDRKPDKKGTAHLESFLTAGLGEDTLVLSANKLDRNQQRSKWFKAFEKNGVIVQARQLSGRALESWIMLRAKDKHLNIERQVADLIATRAEGNMLAASQELEKLALANAGEAIDSEAAVKSISDSSRYDVFKLVDNILMGQRKHVIRMLRGLREEGTEPIIINWALNKELRGLCGMRLDVEKGRSASQVASEAGVWRSRLGMVENTLRHHSARTLRRLFLRTVRIDRMIKGSLDGDPWDEIELLCLSFAKQ